MASILTWNLNDKPLSISNLKDRISGMVGPISIVNVTREDLEFMKAALDCYCNVGIQLEEMTKKMEKFQEEITHHSHKHEMRSVDYPPLTPPSLGSPLQQNQWNGTTSPFRLFKRA